MAAYIKFDGIDGESKAKGHEKWTDLECFSQVIHKAGAGTTGPHVAAARSFTRTCNAPSYWNKSGPKIAEAVCLCCQLTPWQSISKSGNPLQDNRRQLRPRIVLQVRIEKCDGMLLFGFWWKPRNAALELQLELRRNQSDLYRDGQGCQEGRRLLRLEGRRRRKGLVQTKHRRTTFGCLQKRGAVRLI